MRTSAARHCTILLSFAATLALAGCVSTWETKPGPVHSDKLGVSADLPEGWARLNPDKDLAFTRDGFLLQEIRVSREKYGTKIEHTDKTLQPGIAAQEAAQILIDSMMADQSRPHLNVVSNQPATVAGHDGLRLEITYKTNEGLTKHEVLYVALTPDSYVIAKYSAPDRHYFESNSGQFERVVASLKIDAKPPKT